MAAQFACDPDNGHAAATLSIPQDQILKFENEKLEWV
jgi:hypothetical protein